jgi:hypothetical protein
MMATVYCGRHAKVVQIEPPAWAPPVLRWPAIRALLTGCPCADPDPGTFDDLRREIRSLLEDVDDEIATGVISFRVHRIRGVLLSELLDSGEFERILRLGDR